MSTLAYRPCVARSVARSLAQFYRFSSSKAPSNPVTPSTAPSKTPPAIEASSENSAPDARIASSWGNISIPSREDILSKPRKLVPGHARGRDYKPDLSYLKSSSPTSFAGRLAAEAGHNDGTPSKSTNPPDSKLPKLSKSQKQKQRGREQRVAELTAQRRAERLAREAAQAQQKPKAQAKPVQRRVDVFEGTDRLAALSDRRGQFSQRQQSGHRGQRSGQHDKQYSRRGDSASQGGRGGMRTQDSKRPRPVIRITPTTKNDQTLASEDVTLEILEKGGDDKAPAEFRNPDFTATNLDDLFGPSPAQALENVVTGATAPFTEDQVQWLRETYGGDYLRLAPYTDGNFSTEPRKLGPLRHAQFVLSKRADIPFGARKDALSVIASALPA